MSYTAKEVEELKAQLSKLQGREQKRREARRQKVATVTFEMTYLALAGLKYAADTDKVGRAAILNRTFEAVALKHGLEPLQPKARPIASQVVTPIEPPVPEIPLEDNIPLLRQYGFIPVRDSGGSMTDDPHVAAENKRRKLLAIAKYRAEQKKAEEIKANPTGLMATLANWDN